MKTQAQVVVIGGGVVGASVLYHLTKVGITDVVLVERKELTAGSTWHAAGGMHTINGDPNVAKLQQYTIELYDEIERISGQHCGIHITGGVMLADNDDRMDWLRMAHARGRYLGMDTRLLTMDEVTEYIPYVDPSHFVGALYDAVDGHVDPSGVTHAYAGAARQAGAEVYRHTWAHSITQAADGTWDIHLHDTETNEDLGVINCEHFVNAGGLWARDVGRMTGIELPVLAMEHHYLLTEEIPELVEWNKTSGLDGLHCVDFLGEVYMRQEGNGLLLGTYEANGVPWSLKSTSWDFGSELLEPDLDRIAHNLEVAFSHFPIFNEVGIKQFINGPFTFTPDGNPLVGPIRGPRGHWAACGVMAGLSQGGGVGLSVANWIKDGDPGFDIWGMDVARFGDFATPEFTRRKVIENYGRRFRIAYPNEVLPEGRPQAMSPIHSRLVEANAVWSPSFGLEVVQWFQRPGEEPFEDITFRRSNSFDVVAEEVAAVRGGVGLTETTGFAKYEVSGPGARDWLDHLLPNTIPQPGRLALSPMLNESGMLIGDFTVGGLGGHSLGVTGRPDVTTAADAERFMVFGTGAAERYHQRWFTEHLPADGSVRLDTLGHQLGGLSVAGPRARDLMASVCDLDLSTDAFPFLSFTETWIGMIPVLLGRVTFTGDLGYEIWTPAQYQTAVFDLLREAGEPHGVRLFGLQALNSLRLDKGFGSWATEYRPIYDPYEAGFGWTIKLDKGDFIGRPAAAAVKDAGPSRRLVSFTVDVGGGPDAADVLGDEPVWHDDEVVGWVTSGGYAHHSQASVALGYVPSDRARATGGFEIEILGVRRPAQLIDGCLWDPTGSRMRQ
ncbi:MAG: FAD-dependent oxidoreductase [Actinomycetia bacterium]|nr:FAD-dependent oxidoreductase [Actinomycetes bacterium]